VGVLIGAVVIVGVIALLDLVLTFGVIRRLREHTDLLADGAAVPRGAPTIAPVGEPVAAFSVAAVDGSQVSLADRAGEALVGVFGVGCDACEEKLPVFLERAGRFPGGRDAVLAVVVGADDGGAATYVDALTAAAVVVREEDRHGPASAALGVTGYPAFAHVAAGAIRASALDPARLPLPAAGLAGSH
jgi:hypothetical protein